MKYVRKFDRSALSPGTRQRVVAQEEDLGCEIALIRGAIRSAASAPDAETFALMLSGEVSLADEGMRELARPGDLIFLPAGSKATLSGDEHALWVHVSAMMPEGARSSRGASVIKVDQSRFEGTGFAYQSMIDRELGSATMRINVLQVEPGSGSPDFHIHAFAQIYVIQHGEMTLDIGKSRVIAPADSIVILPAGVVHRNFNASDAMERHISLLVPEPTPDEIFDYAVTIHAEEAELLKAIPL